MMANDNTIYPYDVTVTRRENEGFGFVIISSVTKSGSVIGMLSICLLSLYKDASSVSSSPSKLGHTSSTLVINIETISQVAFKQ